MADIIDGKPSMRKFWLPILYSMAGLAVLGYVGYRAYAHWEPERLVSQARAALAKKDYVAARIQLNRALQINPGSANATRFAAEMLEGGGSPDAIKYRAHVVDLLPQSYDDKLLWLAATIRFKQPAEADKAIASFTAAEKKTAAFESYSGALAALLGKYEDAAQHYREAARLDPNDGQYQFDDADMQLHCQDLEIRQAGIDAMKHLATDGRFSSSAPRALIRALIGYGDLEEAFAESEPFQGGSKAEFEDQLTHLELLDRLHKPDEPVYFNKLQAEAGKSADHAGLLIGWMNGHGRAAEAIEWAQTLPQSFTVAPAFAAPLAGCYLSIKDWQSLRSSTENANWDQLEFLRLALLARSQQETGGFVSSEPAWQSAISLAANDRTRLEELRQLVSEWGNGYEPQLDQILMVLGEKWADMKALRILYTKYAKLHDLRQLCKITKLMILYDPSNQNAANNYAIFSMLCKEDLQEAVKIAHELYDSDPHNPTFASTYAYGLYMQGFPAQGLKILGALEPGQLKNPDIAAYYGIILAANDMPDKAIEFLSIAQGDKGLLPEEKALVSMALQDSNEKAAQRKSDGQ